MARQANGRSSVYLGVDGYWHGRITVGTRDDGRPDRRHVMSKSKAKVVARVKALERNRDSGSLHRPGENWTVEQWLTYWLVTIGPFLKDNTLSGYRVAVSHHLVPGVGKHKLRALRPEHLERLYLRIVQTPTKRGTLTRPATAHHVHRTVRTALNEAVRRGYLAKNPALLAKLPRDDRTEDEIEPYTVAEVQRLFQASMSRRNGARWVIALALGLRQGEALGLKWSDVDLEAHILHIRRGRLRPKYKHGCRDTCGRKFPGYCPKRVPVREDTTSPKSRSGRRSLGLPAELCELLRAHRASQNEERLRAGQLWEDGDWLFATETGQPINPRTDWSGWKRLLVEAEVRDGRLHDARHTAATVLLQLGLSDRTMMGVMGWSNPAMTRRYAHMVAPIRRQVADQVAALLWAEDRQAPHAK
jgi:integrase